MNADRETVFRVARAAAAIALGLVLIAANPADPPDQRDPIDDAMKACLDKRENQTTIGMVQCTDDAYKAYDRQLNEIYQRLMKSLDPKSRDLLKESQRLWVQFREAERKLMRAPWQADRGTLASLDIAAADVDAVRERVRELKLYQ